MVKPELQTRYIDAGKVRLVWKDFAWIGEESRLSAQGARCAAQQGKFWEYHDHLYGNQRGENRGQFAAANLKQFAAALGLNAAAFNSCLDKAEDIPTIQRELTEARQRGVTATPTFYVNGQRLVGARSIEAFVAAIEDALSKVAR